MIPIHLSVTLSPFASKINTNYFEGILQVRNITLEVKKYISDFVRKEEIIINKEKCNLDLCDYFFADKRKINKVVNKILRNFGGYVVKNPQLFSYDKQTSKDVFRLTVLLVLPLFKVSDVIFYNNSMIHVTKTSKEISGFDLNKKKYTSFHFTQTEENKISVLKKQKTIVSRIYPRTMVIDPDDYQEKEASNPYKLKLFAGKKVIVVKDKSIFIIK